MLQHVQFFVYLDHSSWEIIIVCSLLFAIDLRHPFVSTVHSMLTNYYLNRSSGIWTVLAETAEKIK